MAKLDMNDIGAFMPSFATATLVSKLILKKVSIDPGEPITIRCVLTFNSLFFYGEHGFTMNGMTIVGDTLNDHAVSTYLVSRIERKGQGRFMSGQCNKRIPIQGSTVIPGRSYTAGMSIARRAKWQRLIKI
ncbi:hypothetical protein [Spirosoma humi]